MTERSGNGKTPKIEPYAFHLRGDADEVDHGDWQFEPREAPSPAEVTGLPILTAGELVLANPALRPFLIDGLLREGETANIIAPPKVGKSWLAYGLAIAVATGRRWLDAFTTSTGDVLLIDNELHRETIAHRLPKVAEAMAVPWSEVAEKIGVLSLRGQPKDLRALKPQLVTLGRGRYKLVIVDAFYRTLPDGTDENSNAEITSLYNLVDSIAAALRASFAFVHHASKGDQSAKAVTDVGSGAGSQSRATDTHIIIRPHQEAGAVVLEAAVRSFPPVPATCLRWTFPVWTPALDLDPMLLRSARSKRRGTGDEKPAKEPKEVWNAKRFAATFGRKELQPRSVVLDEARAARLSDRKANDLLRAALDREFLFEVKVNRRNLITSVRPEPTDGQSTGARAHTPHTPPA
jgi:hypothetical protein